MTEARLAIYLAVAVILAVAVTYLTNDYMQAKQDAAVGEMRGGVLTATSAGAQDTKEIDDFQAGYDAGLKAARTTFQDTKREAIRNEPETAARAVRAVPASVRNAYAERRRARERLGCAGGECRQDDQGGVAGKR